jgi:hypothetical protein
VLVGEWMGGCEVRVVVCGLWCQWVEELGWPSRQVAAGMGDLQRGKCVPVVRAGRQLGVGSRSGGTVVGRVDLK